MAYINKIVVNGQEVNANQLEGILDKDGNARFIEGSMTQPLESLGLTPVYNKWSLSGTHLMLVCAFENNTENDITIADWTGITSTIELPQFIYNKIYVISGNAIGTSSLKGVNKASVATPIDRGNVYFEKTGNAINCYLRTGSGATIESGDYIRVQFDLLIDNASA